MITKYKVYQDEKVTIWQRHHFIIAAESKEAIIERLTPFRNKDLMNTSFSECHIESEFLFDTIEPIPSKKDHSVSTIDTFLEDTSDIHWEHLILPHLL